MGSNIILWGFGDRVLIRPSFAGYNEREDLERLLAALEAELGQRRAP
jgi:selenocysteine lyase/cysteine desulfurase